jgi:hypothetical protein
MLSFELVESRPGPPRLGDNTFLIKLNDAAGPVVDDLTVIPQYGRSRSTAPIVSVDAVSATYTVSSILFFAPGVWRVQIDARPFGSMGSGPLLDSAAFSFCIEP